MKFEPMVKSLLETDLYKINMQRIYFYRFADVMTEYEFKCRTPNIVFTPEMITEINEQVDHLCSLRYTSDELDFIHSIPFHSKATGFLEFLKYFQLDRNNIHIPKIIDYDNVPKAIGPSWAASPFEIYMLEIIGETYYRFTYGKDWDKYMEQFKINLQNKIDFWIKNPFILSEFGGRRRVCHETQDLAIQEFIKQNPTKLFGTSSMYFAKKYGIKPVGTFAHEFVTMMQAIVLGTKSQRFAWEQWAREYQGENGICLTDTLGQEKFERDFTKNWANSFTGLRHDSGDPYEWGERAIELYKKWDIDPKSKTLMFSDSLDFKKAADLSKYFEGRTRSNPAGIGTYCTNDCGFEPLNIVMKLMKANGRDVAKLSNVEGKHMGKESYIKQLKEEIKLEY
jgi:nicotinate phosphoribosyltransferase